MSRTYRLKKHEYRSRFYPEDDVWCERCKGFHFTRWRGNAPICADGVHSESTPNRILKDARRATQRKVGKDFIQKFKADYDIEDIPYLCNKDIRMDYYLI